MDNRSAAIIYAAEALEALDAEFGTCAALSFCENDCPAREACTATNAGECYEFLKDYEWDG